MSQRPQFDPADILPPNRPLRSSMGWASFKADPPDGVLIHVYIVNDEGEAWMSDALWSAEKRAIVHLGYPLDKLGPGARIYCWRARPPEPIDQFLDRCPTVAWIPET